MSYSAAFPGAIIRAVNRGRQFSAWALVAVGLLASGCEARSSAEAAQTAVVAVQTALPASQSVLNTTLGTILAGDNVLVSVSPDGASNDAATDVAISATDARGALQQIDPRARQAAATAALVAAAQYYPNATISVTVTDASGATLLSGSKPPGQTPSVQ
jgi:hypothetical protein